MANDGRGWEPHITSLIKAVVKPGMAAVDVGANIGVHTIALAKAVEGTGHVIAIEPQDVVLRHLHANLVAHMQSGHVKVVCAVATDVVRGAGGNMHSSVPGNIGATSAFVSDHGTIPLTTVDSLTAAISQPVGFVKINAQGFEMKVLRGAWRTLQASRPVMLVEIQERCLKACGSSTEDVMTWLVAHNYVLYRIRATDPRLTFFADHLCVPAERDGEQDWGALTGYPCDRVYGEGRVQCVFGPEVEHAYVSAALVPTAPAHIHAVCYNEAQLLPLFVAFYRQNLPGVAITIHDNESTDDTCTVAASLGCQVEKLHTDGKFFEEMLTERRSTCWQNDVDNSPWVIVCDCDEFIPVTADELNLKTPDTSVLETTGYQMIGSTSGGSNTWPPTITTGVKLSLYNKPVIFRRRSVAQVKFALGSHSASFTPYKDMGLAHERNAVPMFHYHFLSPEYAFKRLSSRRTRYHERTFQDHQSRLCTSLQAVTDWMHSFGTPVEVAGARDLFTKLAPTFSTEGETTTRKILARIQAEEISLPRTGDVLEVGCFEGRTSLNLAETFCDAQIYCVDPWYDGTSSSGVTGEMSAQYGRFLFNTCLQQDRLCICRGSSETVLPRLQASNLKLRFAYIGGDHSARGAYTDAEQVWPMIVRGGLLLFDNQWNPEQSSDDESPRQGIMKWLDEHKRAYDVDVIYTWQVLVRKL